MKRIFYLIFFCAFVSFGQSPTYNETGYYIRDKVAETVSHQVLWKNNNTNFIMETKFAAITRASEVSAHYFIGNYKTKYDHEDNVWRENYYYFNPKFIVSVAEASSNVYSNSPVGFLAIHFSGDVVREVIKEYYLNPDTPMEQKFFYPKDFKFNVISQKNVNVLFLPYFKQDPTAFQRLEKAIMHLKSFHVEEDDPFAN